jgi:hypothetical protein
MSLRNILPQAIGKKKLLVSLRKSFTLRKWVQDMQLDNSTDLLM